jgi:hypothetical protein
MASDSRRRAYLSMLRRRVLELLGRGFNVYVSSEYRGIVAELVPAIACSFAPVLSTESTPSYARYFAKLSKCSSSPSYYLIDNPRANPEKFGKPALVIAEKLPPPAENTAILEFSAKKAAELQQQGYRVYYLSLE